MMTSDRYIKCVDLKKFDRLQTYYIATEQLYAGEMSIYVGDQQKLKNEI